MHAGTWNFECSESIQTVATASPRIGPGLEYGHARSSRKELRCLTNVRTPCAAPSFVTSIKEGYLKLKFNTPTVSLATVKAGQGNGKRHVERCWLCDECAEHIMLRFDARRGVVMVSFLRGPDEILTTAILQSSDGAKAGIAPVLVRRLDMDLDLTVSTRRRSAIKLNVRRSEAA